MSKTNAKSLPPLDILSTKLTQSIADFEALTKVYGHTQIIKTLIEGVVWKSIESPKQAGFFSKYSPKEQADLQDILEILQQEIQAKIQQAKAEKSLYPLPEIKLTYHHPVPHKERPQILQSSDAYRLLLENWSDQIEYIEEFNLLLLDRANTVLGIYRVSKGGTSTTVVDTKVIFSAALKANATSIILAHNHPSGNIFPSKKDLEVTAQLKEAGDALKVPVIDHLIIAPKAYYSFTDEGIL